MPIPFIENVFDECDKVIDAGDLMLRRIGLGNPLPGSCEAMRWANQAGEMLYDKGYYPPGR
jgi:hypothetical protein